MKLNKTIRRIAALATGATMLGATVLGAMAADLSTYPSPMFIKDGKFNGLIVIGADAATQDMLGAMDIISSLQAVAVSGSATGVKIETIGDVYQFAKSSDKLNLGESIADIRTKLFDTQLPIILADGILTTAKGSKYDYEQEIAVASGNDLNFFADKDYENEKPTIGMEISRSDNVLNYTLDFSKDAESTVCITAPCASSGDWTDFEDRQIEMLGEVFDIISSDNSTLTLDLMRGALKPTMEEGETQTFTINSKQYEVTVLIVDDTDGKVKFKVNGEVTDSMVEGDIYELSDGTLIGLRETLPNEAGDVTQDMVEFYLGAKKIVLTNGEELEIDNEDISNVDVAIVASGGTTITIDSIGLIWDADDDLYVTEDNNEVVMPGLESIKLYMDGFYNGKEEKITVAPSGDDTIELGIPLMDYDVTLDILYTASSTDGTWDVTGSDIAANTGRLLLGACSANFAVDMDLDEYFAITRIDATSGKDAETAILQLTKVDDTDGITIKDYAGDVVAQDKKATKTFDAADMTVTVLAFNETRAEANLSVELADCVNYTIVSKEGLKINLTGASGNALRLPNTTAYFVGNNSAIMTITEEDKDETIAAADGYDGVQYALNLTFNSDTDANVKLISKAFLSNARTYSVDDTEVYVGYTNSTVSSKITEDLTSDQNDIEIQYPGEETYGDLYIGSKASKVTSTGGESTPVTKIEVGAAVMDTSLTSYTSQNLIVVGGPAINRGTAALLGKTYPSYGADSGIAENSGMIKLVEQADGTVAVIVAGWEAMDTQRACRVLAESDQYALSGAEVAITGTSMTDIVVGVPA